MYSYTLLVPITKRVLNINKCFAHIHTQTQNNISINTLNVCDLYIYNLTRYQDDHNLG